jgi:hypothetical protein
VTGKGEREDKRNWLKKKKGREFLSESRCLGKEINRNRVKVFFRISTSCG